MPRFILTALALALVCSFTAGCCGQPAPRMYFQNPLGIDWVAPPQNVRPVNAWQGATYGPVQMAQPAQMAPSRCAPATASDPCAP